MVSAKDREELINLGNNNFNKIFDLIDSMSDEEWVATFTFDPEKQGKEAHWKRDKNIRDVLVHLYEWHNLLIEWEKTNSSGVEKSFIPSPYNWKTYGDMNVEFWKKHQTTPFEEAKEQLWKSHKKVMQIIEKYSQEEIFTKKYFKWTGTSCLEQYFIGATARHYEWAIKKLKTHLKTLEVK